MINNIANGMISGGGVVDIDFANLSSYGKIFYEFINDSNFDKKVVQVG